MFTLASDLLQNVSMMDDGNSLIQEMQQSVDSKFEKVELPKPVVIEPVKAEMGEKCCQVDLQDDQFELQKEKDANYELNLKIK